MTPRSWRSPCIVAVASLLFVACAPLDDLSAGRGGPGSGGGGAGGGLGGSGGNGPAGPDTLVLDVVTTGLDDLVAQQPATGAVVALDLPGGTRLEETVGDDGRVVFEGLAWSLPGTEAVTAYLPGYVPQSFVGLTEDSVAALAALDGTEVLTLALRPVAPECVKLSGMAEPMVDPAHTMMVRATTRCSSITSAGPGWTTLVRPGVATTLVALEYGSGSVPTSSRGSSVAFEQWAIHELATVDGDQHGILIDMGAAPEISTVSGSIEVPSHGTSPFFDQAVSSVVVSSAESGGKALLGWTEWIDVTADGSAFEYDLQHVTLPAVEHPWTTHNLYWSAAGLSRLRAVGYPTAGPQPGVWPEPIQLDESIETMLGERFAWQMNAVDAADPSLRVQVTIRTEQEQSVRWQLTMAPGTTTMTLPPALPSNAEPDEVLGHRTLEAVVEHCEPGGSHEAYRGHCRRYSQSLPVPVHRPPSWGSPFDDCP